MENLVLNKLNDIKKILRLRKFFYTSQFVARIVAFPWNEEKKLKPKFLYIPICRKNYPVPVVGTTKTQKF